MRMILGLDRPPGGEVTVKGRPPRASCGYLLVVTGLSAPRIAGLAAGAGIFVCELTPIPAETAQVLVPAK